ncbi:helix-turn-helix transcriptional regulator [Calidifontibacter sp. DB0510]|uniref:Helix-turn-helix transcriptional regulator n=1 Tax=Metallococcus carri TaxID=1656884 RepID=A0A967B4K4_9MICO|nr:helix-turn-helix domain-containing protein [Metallococcus carri]NHN57245.1 helix-turn-helix transcriptional regulator [Metallococcus carri]NOP37952.1 helix-turn-helix transcriptional regulator [Calidifontibacter sp. DB2511S]
MATKTAAARRAKARQEFNSYFADCPSRKLLDRISDKWVALILSSLGEADGPMRFSQLHRHIAGVSQKMLTQTLRNLEGDGLVTRTVTPTVPVTVHYALTPLGESLLEVIKPLKAWADTHIEQIEAARAAS